MTRRLSWRATGWALSLIVAGVAPAMAGDGAASSPAKGDASPAPDYEPVRGQQGVWDADIRFFDVDGKPSGQARGVQRNELLSNGHWVTNDFRVFDAAGVDVPPSFQGHGVWGWDPVAREYIDAWVDTHDGAVRIDHGSWNADTRTMYWTALQPDGQGHSVNYRMTEQYEKDGLRTLTFFQVALQSGRLVKLAEIRFTRRDKA